MYLCRQIQTLLLAPYRSQANCIKATANKVVKFNMNLVLCWSVHFSRSGMIPFVDTITKGHSPIYDSGFTRTS